MLGVRDAITAIKQMLVIEERVGRLARDVAGNAREVNAELAAVRAEQRELRDRVSRIEGAFAVLDRLRISENKQ
ncbi:MAG TPA: hypothetical protein VFA48_06735 [Gammaproteobacteria bacterium]|nr:hypothetical protein [Gammaproteobacteria bacterium]